MYKVSELTNGQLLKVSLRSVEHEDTTPISQVVFELLGLTIFIGCTLKFHCSLYLSLSGLLQKYGGGGHRNASSFMLSSVEFDSWKDL